jgi:hypothetical protein
VVGYSFTHTQTVEKVIALGLGVLLEQLDVLEHLGVDVDFLVETHRVLTQEIEHNLGGGLERYVLVAQRTTTNSIRLVFSLFVTRTESKTIDKVQSGRSLAVRHDLGFEVLGVVSADHVDVFLKCQSL